MRAFSQRRVERAGEVCGLLRWDGKESRLLVLAPKQIIVVLIGVVR